MAEPQRNVLDVQKIAVRVGIADRSLSKPTQEPHINQVLASVPPVYLLEELLGIERVVAVQLVLIHHKTVPFRGISDDGLVLLSRVELGS